MKLPVRASHPPVLASTRGPRFGLLWALLSSAILPGCGRAHGDEEIDEEIDETRLLGSLSEAESRSLCHAQNQRVVRDPAFFESVCAVQAIARGASGLASCEELRDQCLSDSEPLCSVDSPPDYGFFARQFACTKLTAGMVLDCNEANHARAKPRYAAITCDSDGDEIDQLFEDLLEGLRDDPGGCKAAFDACPQLGEKLGAL